MSDMIDYYRATKAARYDQKRRLGVSCPVCMKKLPRSNPKTLLPGQTCRAHTPHYRDPRPETEQRI